MLIQHLTMSRWRRLVALIAAFGLAVPLSAQEMDPEALLKRMSDQIAGLDAFVLTGDSYADARLAEGQIIEHASKVTLRLMRPNGLRLINETSEGAKEIFFNDGVITVSSQPQNYYAQTEIPEGIESAVEFAMDELHIDAPLLDLLAKNVAENLSKDASGIRYLGKSLVREKIYHHVGLRGPEIDLQVWIAVDGPALPGKIVMTSKWEGGSPRFVAFLNWDTNPEIPSGSLEFKPAEGAVRIEFIR